MGSNKTLCPHCRLYMTATEAIARVAATITRDELLTWLYDRAENCARLSEMMPDKLAWQEDECHFRAAIAALSGCDHEWTAITETDAVCVKCKCIRS